MKKALVIIAIIIHFNSAFSQQKVSENFLQHIGDSVTILGKIYGGAFLKNVSTKPTFLNLGDTNPNHRLMIRIEPEDRDKFPGAPETYFLNKTISVTGTIEEYKGTALIKVSQPELIKTEPEATSSASTLPNNVFKNSYTPAAVANTSKTSDALKTDTVLQSAWIKSVTNKAVEQTKVNVRIVQRDISLRTAPADDAPVIAELHAGMAVSIVFTSKKWSYINVGSIDGFNGVNGFIKHKRFKYLKKSPQN